MKRRARGAILGAMVGDRAAMGVHWVYNPQDLDRLLQERRKKTDDDDDDDIGLEFYDPPQSPYFSYASGRASPYGEQADLLLTSLVKEEGLHPCHYAEALVEMYGRGGWDGYRDASIKGFLRNWYRGLKPPACGADDHQVGR